MADENARVAAAADLIRGFEPRYKLRTKSGSRLQRALGWFMAKLGNPSYMRDFWTTIGYTSYSPAEVGPGSWRVVLHEGVHALQARRLGRVPLAVFYLFPQWIGLAWIPTAVATLICGAHPSWWWLLPLLTLAPIPAPGRENLEAEAYDLSLALDLWYGGQLGDAALDPDRLRPLVGYFTGGAYYRMALRAGPVRERFERVLAGLRKSGSLGDPDPWEVDYQEILDYREACKAMARRFAAEDA